MSNTKKTYTFAVATSTGTKEVEGTGAHIESGHLVIEDSAQSVAMFAPTDWHEVIRRGPSVSEMAAEVGRVAAHAADELFGQLGINTKEN